MKPRYEALARKQLQEETPQTAETARFLEVYDALAARGIIILPGQGMSIGKSADHFARKYHLDI